MKMYKEFVERKYYKNGSQTFNASSQFQTFTVPATVTELNIDCVASKGADSSTATGGSGGRIKCTLPVTPSSSLYIYVGDIPSSFTTAEYNATDIRTDNTGVTDNTSLSSRLVVAGGGGSAGSYTSTPILTGGNGGGEVGGNGVGRTNLGGGKGGTQTSGGSASSSAATAGSFGLGANGSSSGSVGVGAGGAGWYGGSNSGKASNGATNAGGGGGGSSYADSSCYRVEHTQGYNDGEGYITITYIEEGTESDYDFYEDIYRYKAKNISLANTNTLYTPISLEKNQIYPLMPTNFVKVGTPTIDYGILSNCSLTSFVQLSSAFAPGNKPWKFQIAFQLDYPGSSSRYALFNETKSDWISPKVEITTDSSSSLKIGTRISTNGTSWTLASGYDFTVSSYDYSKMSYINLSYTGTQYVMKFRQEGEDFVTKWSATYAPFYQSADCTGISLGADIGSGGQWVSYFPGKINLYETYIKIDGVYWFNSYLFLNPPTPTLANIVGSPTITDGVVSDFSATNYLQTESTINVKNISESNFRIFIDESQLGDNQNFYLFQQKSLLQIFFNKYQTYGTQLSVYVGGANHATGRIIPMNSWIDISTTYDGVTFKTYLTANGIKTEILSFALDLSSLSEANPCTFGRNQYSTGNYFRGSIDFNNTYIKVNGYYFFKGQIEEES